MSPFAELLQNCTGSLSPERGFRRLSDHTENVVDLCCPPVFPSALFRWPPRPRLSTSTQPTIEDAYRLDLTIDGQQYEVNIVDTAGQEEYRGSWAEGSAREADGFIAWCAALLCDFLLVRLVADWYPTATPSTRRLPSSWYPTSSTLSAKPAPSTRIPPHTAPQKTRASPSSSSPTSATCPPHHAP